MNSLKIIAYFLCIISFGCFGQTVIKRDACGKPFAKDEGAELTVRSCRGTGAIYIDGERVIVGLPKKLTEEITVLLGGIPVNYGDIKGCGIIYVTPRKPQSDSSKTAPQEIKIIIGGLPGTYGDLNGGVIKLQCDTKKTPIEESNFDTNELRILPGNKKETMPAIFVKPGDLKDI